jgi:hypothetical protein
MDWEETLQKAEKVGNTTDPGCNGQIWVGNDGRGGPPDQDEAKGGTRPAAELALGGGGGAPHHNVVHGWSTAINKVF